MSADGKLSAIEGGDIDDNSEPSKVINSSLNEKADKCSVEVGFWSKVWTLEKGKRVCFVRSES